MFRRGCWLRHVPLYSSVPVPAQLVTIRNRLAASLDQTPDSRTPPASVRPHALPSLSFQLRTHAPRFDVLLPLSVVSNSVCASVVFPLWRIDFVFLSQTALRLSLHDAGKGLQFHTSEIGRFLFVISLLSLCYFSVIAVKNHCQITAAASVLLTENAVASRCCSVVIVPLFRRCSVVIPSLQRAALKVTPERLYTLNSELL